METLIKTIPELRKAIRKCKYVYATIRFGVSENYVQLTKEEALFFLKDYPDDATPRNHEMSDGESFGTLHKDNILYLG